MGKYTRILAEDGGKIIKKLNPLINSTVKPSEKRKEITLLLQESFHAQACIIALPDPNWKDVMVIDAIAGKLTDDETLTDQECEGLNNDLLKTVKRSLESAERMEEETIIKTMIIEDKKTIGIIATLIQYKNRVLGMLIVVRSIKPCRNDLQVFNRIKSHIIQIIGPDLLSNP